MLGKIGLAAIENSSASACTDALDASLTFWRSDNTSSDPKDKAPMPLRQRSTENDDGASIVFSISMSSVADLHEATCTSTVSNMSTAFAAQCACVAKVDLANSLSSSWVTACGSFVVGNLRSCTLNAAPCSCLHEYR